MPVERIAGSAAGLLLTLVLLAGCGGTVPVAGPTTPEQPWVLPDAVRADVKTALAASGDPAVPDPAGAGNRVDPNRDYALSELIDIAQRHNPATRVAWEAAHQAALATGTARSTLLPRLAASVVGGYQRLSTPVTLPLVGTRTLTADVQEIIPILTVEWLLFDFGERAAAVEASRHLATVANVQFNQMHQQIVFDVSRAYHAGIAAEHKAAAAIRALAAARHILAAAETRERQGLDTRIEIAQARLQLAQTNLSLVQAQGEAATARVALNAALGLPHSTRIRLRDPGERLPAAAIDSLDQVIERALVERPDIIAGVAQLRAAEAGERVAAAGYWPKVGLIGALSTDDNRFSFNGGSTFGTPVQQTGVLIGVTLPLYQGGLRDSTLRGARSRVTAAQAAVAGTRGAAAAEIAAAYEALRTSLAAHQAADALVAAAGVTAAAARQGLELGLGDLTTAIAAEKDLLGAEEARADTRRDAFDAAATLAFVTAALPADAPRPDPAAKLRI